MVRGGHRKSFVFIALGVCLVALAVALNIGWIVITRAGMLLILGVLFFLVIIAGLVFNTIFLVREIRRNEQHDAFINAVTHELKTPVTSIRLYLQTLQARALPPDKEREFYAVMLADSDRLMQTIEQVLQAGATGHRRRPVRRQAVDLADVARECLPVALARHHLHDDAVSYAERLNGRRAVVSGDPDELRAAVSNLLDNAIKYSRDRVQIRVEVARPDADHVTVRVTDAGIGIPRPELGRIFKRFYRIHDAAAARVKGTGLGLFIVRSIARRHGGRVFAESEGPGRGSTFTLQLPAAPAP